MVPFDWFLVTGVLFACLAFHFAYCRVPSLRYFNARRGAYLIGGGAYALIALLAVVDGLFGLSTLAFRAYVVLAFVLLTIIAFRPYAFVGASSGPRGPTRDNEGVIDGTRARAG